MIKLNTQQHDHHAKEVGKEKTCQLRNTYMLT